MQIVRMNFESVVFSASISRNIQLHIQHTQQGRFQSFGQGGARWRVKRGVNFWPPPAGGCQFLQGGANH